MTGGLPGGLVCICKICCFFCVQQKVCHEERRKAVMIPEFQNHGKDIMVISLKNYAVAYDVQNDISAQKQ